MQRKFRLILILLLTILISACGTNSPKQNPSPTPNTETPPQVIEVTPTPIVIDEDLSALTGIAVTTYNGNPEPMGNTGLRLAKVFWEDETRDNGTFILDGAFSPATISSPDGSFAFVDIEPGEYVLVIGDLMQDHEIVSEPNGDAAIWTTKTGEITDVGTIEVFLAP